MSPETATILQPLTLPVASIASAITCRPSNVSPGSTSEPPDIGPGVNRRSNVIRVNSDLLPDCLPIAAWLPTTSQSCAPAGRRLDSKWHDCGLPSPAMVTVTFSHHGAVELRVSAAFEGAAARLWAEAEMR